MPSQKLDAPKKGLAATALMWCRGLTPTTGAPQQRGRTETSGQKLPWRRQGKRATRVRQRDGGSCGGVTAHGAHGSRFQFHSGFGG